jgi:glycosyltransferase involved in cell wall biosynthesis
MRIAYVTINIDPRIINGGVGMKIRSQVSLWKSMGHSVELFVLTPETVSLQDARQFIFRRPAGMLFLNFLARELSRSFTLMQMISDVQKYQPQIIYFRFGLFTFPIHKLFKIAPLILEVNSNDLDEYRSRGMFFYWLNRVTRNFMFSHCAGWVASSHELAEREENRRHKKPVCVVSNGIELDKYQPFAAPQNRTPTLTLVGSPGMNWHGVDKLFALAKQYPDLAINVIGYRPEDINLSTPINLRLHGYLTHQDIRNVLAVTDVVFGTLALHRKKMEEASPLKVREALAYGIPIVIAYRDTDLNDLRVDTVLQLPNTEENVIQNAIRIHKFAYDMIGKRVDLDSLAPHIDQRRKEHARLTFFRAILGDQVQ